MFYYFYVLLTAPGVAIHELAHSFFCWIAGVRIRKIKLFQFGNPAGYVVHDEPNNVIKAWLITFGPLILNSLLTLLCFSQIKFNFLDHQNIVQNLYNFNYYDLVFLWFGFAIGMHAIPSHADAKSLTQTIKYRFWKNPLVIIFYPFALVLHILNFLKRLHIDIVYIGFLFWVAVFYLR